MELGGGLGVWLAMASMVAAATAAAGAAQPSEDGLEPPKPSIEWLMGSGDDAPAEPKLVVERAALVPGGTAHLGISFEIDPGWHTYWPGQNGTGYGVSIDWDLPDGLTVGEVMWPAPRRYYDAKTGLLDHVYEGRVTLVVPVEVGPELEPGRRVELAADLDWLVCERACIPGRARVTLGVSVAAAGSSPAESGWAAWFDRARARMPRPLGLGAGEGGAGGTPPPRLAPTDEGVRATFPGAGSVSFYPHEDGVGVRDLVERGTVAGETITLPLAADPGQPGRLKGVFEVTYPGRPRPALWSVDMRLSDLSASGR